MHAGADTAGTSFCIPIVITRSSLILLYFRVTFHETLDRRELAVLDLDPLLILSFGHRDPPKPQVKKIIPYNQTLLRLQHR